MQATSRRALVLAAVFAVGLAVYWGGNGAEQSLANRWPTEESVYGVDGWVVGDPSVSQAHGVSYVSRTYTRADRQTAVLSVATSSSAKAIYRAGAEVPFLGSGYAVDAPPPDAIPSAPGRSALVVRHGNQAGAVLYVYGERRGALGNGPLAWALVGVDAVLGRSNDYYLATVLVPYDSGSRMVRADFVALADAVLPRLAAWYGAA
jgi:hypothetical protein